MNNIRHLRQHLRQSAQRVPIEAEASRDKVTLTDVSRERLAFTCCALGFASGVVWSVLFQWMV